MKGRGDQPGRKPGAAEPGPKDGGDQRASRAGGEPRPESRRQRQIANAIREELVMIFRRDINDPALEAVGFITISGVELAPDMRNGSVWVAFMGKSADEKYVKAAIEAMNGASRFIQRLLIK